MLLRVEKEVELSFQRPVYWPSPPPPLYLQAGIFLLKRQIQNIASANNTMVLFFPMSVQILFFLATHKPSLFELSTNNWKTSSAQFS